MAAAKLKRKQTRDSFRALSNKWLEDAGTLLEAGRYDAAYYVAGYAVECALKACIAATANRFDFPDKDTVNQSYTHGLEQLLGVAGLLESLRIAWNDDEALARYWPLVNQWDEESRYDAGMSAQEARDFYQAITDPDHGILQWIRHHW